MLVTPTQRQLEKYKGKMKLQPIDLTAKFAEYPVGEILKQEPVVKKNKNHCNNQFNLLGDELDTLNSRDIVNIIILSPNGSYVIECYTRDEIPKLASPDKRKYISGNGEEVFLLPYSNIYIDKLSMKILQMYRYFVMFPPVEAQVGYDRRQMGSLKPLSRENFKSKNYSSTEFVAGDRDVQYKKYIGRKHVILTFGSDVDVQLVYKE